MTTLVSTIEYDDNAAKVAKIRGYLGTAGDELGLLWMAQDALGDYLEITSAKVRDNKTGYTLESVAYTQGQIAAALGILAHTVEFDELEYVALHRDLVTLEGEEFDDEVLDIIRQHQETWRIFEDDDTNRRFTK